MRFEIRWKTGLAPALVAVTRERLTLGLARFAGRLGKVVLWRELRTEGGTEALHWVVRVELVGGEHLVVSAPDPAGDADAALHIGARVTRAVERCLATEPPR